MIRSCEYIWLDGTKPTQKLRSKTRYVDLVADVVPAAEALPTWSFDGSSTNQSSGNDSDLLLEPVRVVNDPFRSNGLLVMCEVLHGDGAPHATNARSALRATLDQGAGEEDPWFGFEQEYTLFRDGRPLGFPVAGFPEPQGKYYCGVGAQEAFGRKIVETHAELCLQAGLLFYGTNAEVMPGQWEFQIGYRGVPGESADPLAVADHLWIARWLLHRVAEDHGVTVSFDPKPMEGDWNGAGAHTNVSTNATRSEGGLAAIHEAVQRLSLRHAEHIAVYGAGLETRLTGEHETCSIHEFRSGVADRGSSIRIPTQVSETGSGYLEDRRPGANCDPYCVCDRILMTICALDAPALKRAG